MDRVTRVLVTTTAMFFVSGCLGPGAPMDDGDSETAESVDVRELDHGQNSGHQERQRLVITDAGEWEKFWEKHTEKSFPPAEAPEVDFGSERVVAVLQGDRPNGCHHVAVTNVTRGADDGTRVEVTEYVPSDDMVCTDQIVQPFHFIAVPADESAVEYEERSVQGAPG